MPTQSQNLTLFVNRVFSDIILGWFPNPETGVHRKRPCEDTQTHREESHMTREEEIGVVPLQARGHKGFPEPPATRRESWNRVSSESPGGTNSEENLILGF